MSADTNKILVIDDENAILLMMDDILDILGFKMEGVMTAKEGLEKLEQEDFAYIICDLSLPDINGREFFNRAVIKKPDIKGKFVFASGYLNTGELKDFCDANEIAFLNKPFKIENIQEVLK